jgi:hypothetical protein
MKVLPVNKFLNYFNVPKHIRNYFIRRKIAKYSGAGANSFGVFVIDFLIIAMFAGAVYYIYLINRNWQIKAIGLVACLLFLLFFITKVSVFVKKKETKYEGIKKLILKDDEGRNVKVWDLETKTAVLIGKKTRDNEVDIDLSQTDYATLVSKQHAVLNFSENCWYVEDLGSTNGSGVRRPKANLKVKLEAGKPFKLSIGDVLYIANLKILVQ